ANFVTGINCSPANGIIYQGGRIIITPSLTGGTWDYDHDYLSGDFSDPDKAVFTALKEGKTRIYYQPKYTFDVNGNVASYTYYSDNDNKVYTDVTINKTILPQTGQNFTFAITLALIGMLMAAATIFIRIKKPN
ncbi:MAG: LPXTG cell wall anchor domain-containing protein, partial [Eubacteriaceae bacterium]|nr:LPXTG cell wall anchor domain-containing protein [Eubacteriaceae bacterium]